MAQPYIFYPCYLFGNKYGGKSPMMDILVSLLIALIVGLGIGGGGFFVIYLTLCLNYPQLIAQGTNLTFFLISGISSLFVHVKRRRLFVKELIPIIAVSVPATILGSSLANNVDPKIPTVGLSVFLIVSGIISLIKVIKKFKYSKK